MVGIGSLYTALLGQGLAPRSSRLYVRTIQSADRYFDEHGWTLSRATPEQVAAYAATKPLTFSSRSLVRIALGHYWAITDHPSPPVRAVRCPPKPEMVCKALDADNARILAKAARSRGDRKGLAVLLGLYQGMRREEIATSRWDGISTDGWWTVVGKGAKSRTIPVHFVVRRALDKHPRSGPFLFAGRGGGHVSPATIWTWVRAVADEAGVGKVRPHWLRHTALATQNDVTGDLRAVQVFAGHARSATTEGYTRATKSALMRVSDALDY